MHNTLYLLVIIFLLCTCQKSKHDVQIKKDVENIEEILFSISSNQSHEQNSDELKRISEHINKLALSFQTQKEDILAENNLDLSVQNKNYSDYFEYLKIQLDDISSQLKIEQPKEKIAQLFYKSDSVKIGDQNTFVLTGSLGTVVKIQSPSEVRRVYSINKYGTLILQDELLSQDEFPLNHPIEAFSVVSPSIDSINYSDVFVTINEKTDTIISKFIDRTIIYDIDSIDIYHFSKKNEISFRITFSPSIIEQLEADIEISLLINGEENILYEKMALPKDVSEFSKRISYPIKGRIPYQFEVKSINLININAHKYGIKYKRI